MYCTQYILVFSERSAEARESDSNDDAEEGRSFRALEDCKQGFVPAGAST